MFHLQKPTHTSPNSCFCRKECSNCQFTQHQIAVTNPVALWMGRSRRSFQRQIAVIQVTLLSTPIRMALHLILFPKGPKMFIENCFQPAFLENMRALAVQIGRSFPGVTGKPVHTYLLWFAAHAVPSSTCKIVVSQPKLASELASTASVGWLLRESGAGASTASKIMHAVQFSMLESRIKASNYFPSAKSGPHAAVKFTVCSGSTSRPLLVSIECQVRPRCSFAELLIIEDTIHNAIPALPRRKWFRNVSDNPKWWAWMTIVLVALDSAYILFLAVPNAFLILPTKHTEGRPWKRSVRTWLLACYRYAHCLLRKNGKMT